MESKESVRQKVRERLHAKVPKARKLSGEPLHRAASFIIICEGLFHTFKHVLPVVIAIVIFGVVEILIFVAGGEEV